MIGDEEFRIWDWRLNRPISVRGILTPRDSGDVVYKFTGSDCALTVFQGFPSKVLVKLSILLFPEQRTSQILPGTFCRIW